MSRQDTDDCCTAEAPVASGSLGSSARVIADELQRLGSKYADGTPEHRLVKSAVETIYSLQAQERHAREENARNAMALGMQRDRMRLALFALQS